MNFIKTTFQEIPLFWGPDVQDKISLQMEPISCPETSETNLPTQHSATSGFGREVDECYLLLDCYAASGGNSLPKRRGGTDGLHRNVGMGPTGCTGTSGWDRRVAPERRDGTDRLHRNVGKGLPLLAAYTTQKNAVFKPAKLNYT